LGWERGSRQPYRTIGTLTCGAAVGLAGTADQAGAFLTNQITRIAAPPPVRDIFVTIGLASL
jgi:hypothetical protein